MTDIIDEANNRVAAENECLVAQAQMAARNIPKGNPGICAECGDYSGRLVFGKCAPCRDFGLRRIA